MIVQVRPRERMIATIGMHTAHTEDLMSSNKEVKDRCVGASIAMKWITYLLIVPNVVAFEDRGRILTQKQLYSNCTSDKHSR